MSRRGALPDGNSHSSNTNVWVNQGTELTRTAGKPSPQKRLWALSCGGGMLAYAPR